MKVEIVRITCKTSAIAIILLAGAGLSSGHGIRAAAQGPPPPAVAEPFDPHDLSGYWELGQDGRSVPPADLVSSITKAKLDEISRADMISMRWCRPLGFPADMDNGRPIGITQGRFETLITLEGNAMLRHIRFQNEHINPDVYDPGSAGDSIAHWEGDTMVVDTIGFDKTNGRLHVPGGGFRTEDSHVVERYKLLKNGNVLSVTFTWTDPKVFKTPHTYEFRYTRVPGKYEERTGIGCNPWDGERTEFVTRTWSPELKKAAQDVAATPGSDTSTK